MFLTVLSFEGCGGIRFSEVAPEARNFHPQSIAVLSLDVGGSNDAMVVDGIIAREIKDRHSFNTVISLEEYQNVIREKEELRKASEEYIDKLRHLDYIDPELSKKIGIIAGVDAFLLVTVDYWYYTKEADKNIAKVGLGMMMINARTGSLIWKARHHMAVDYVLIKPVLSNIAGDVVKQMIDNMPQ